MNSTKFLIAFGLCSFIFNNAYTSEARRASPIAPQETFTTIEEKTELCRRLGIEYTHEVTMTPELRRQLLAYAITPAAQAAFAANDTYQYNMRNQRQFQALAQDRSTTNSMVIKKINSNVGYGVFASARIKEGTFLGMYSGELKVESAANADNDYYFDCPSITPGCPELIIDAQHKRNELAFINGSINHANCQAQVFLVPTGEQRFLFRATQDIEQGKQLLADYGAGYWKGHRKNQYQELGNEPTLVQNSSTFGQGFKKGFLK